MREHLIKLAIIAALSFQTANAGEQHRVEPPISKIEARKQAEPIVIRRVLNQIADLLLLPSQAGADDDDYGPLSQSDKAKILSELFAIAQSQPNADRTIAPPQLDDAGVRRTLSDLGGLVTIWPNPYISQRPTTPLRQIAFQTRVYATEIPQLCAIDIVGVDFRRAGMMRGPNTRTLAAAVHTMRYYYFLQSPAAPTLERSSETQRRQTDIDCAKLDQNETPFFTAANELQAVKGIWLARSLLSQLRATPIPFGVLCDTPANLTPTECVSELITYQSQTNFNVGDCNDTTCKVTVGWMTSEIQLAPRLIISSVSVTGSIIIADPLQD